MAKSVTTGAIIGILYLSAILIVWEKSGSSGLGHEAQAQEIGRVVGKAARLSPACRKIAEHLVEAAIRKGMTEFRPTGRFFSRAEAKAVSLWEAAMCPSRAVPAIVYGASSVVTAKSRDTLTTGRGS